MTRRTSAYLGYSFAFGVVVLDDRASAVFGRSEANFAEEL